MSDYPFDDAPCPDYVRGFRAGVEAAARVVEADPPGGDPEWRTARIADAIRTLAPPTPEPATRCDACGGTGWKDRGGGIRCTECFGLPAPAPGPSPEPVTFVALAKCGICGYPMEIDDGVPFVRESADGKGIERCLIHAECAPAPGPERCGHARYSPNTGIVTCLDCGAVNNLGDGLGWTGGRP